MQVGRGEWSGWYRGFSSPDQQHPHLCATIWFISNRITFTHTLGHLVVFIGLLLFLLTHGQHPQSMRLFGHLHPPLSRTPWLFILAGSEPFCSILIQFGSTNTRTHICHYSLCSLRSHLARQYGFGSPCGLLAAVPNLLSTHPTHNRVLILNVYGYFIAAIRVIRLRSGSCRSCFGSLLSG